MANKDESAAKEQGKWYKGYSFEGVDGATLDAKFDLRVTPIRPLAIDLGLHFRSGRSYLEPTDMTFTKYVFSDMDDMINLHVGASYRFDKVLTLWAKGNNLLNRKWDYMPGMGAQGFNLMGGVSLVF